MGVVCRWVGAVGVVWCTLGVAGEVDTASVGCGGCGGLGMVGVGALCGVWL